MITPSASSPPIDSRSVLSDSERKLFSTYSQCSDDSDIVPLPNQSRFLCGTMTQCGNSNFSSLKGQLKKKIGSNNSERGLIKPSPTSDALADHLADGMVLLSNQFCPLCNSNLVKPPIDGSPPLCPKCTSVAGDIDSNSLMYSSPPGSASIGDNLKKIFDVEEEIEKRLIDAEIDYSVGRESASKIIGSKMIEGFALQDVSCDNCSMPLMKKEKKTDDDDDGTNDAPETSSHPVECVVCPYLLNLKRKELRKVVEVEAKRIEEENKLLESRISQEKSRMDKERNLVFAQMNQIKADAEKSKNDAEEARRELAVAQEKRRLAEEDTARQTEQMKTLMNEKLAEMMQEEVKVYEDKIKLMEIMEEEKNLNDTKVADELKEKRKVKIRMTEIEWNRLEELLGMEETRLREELKIIRDSSKRGEAVQQRRILAIKLKVKEEKEFVYAEKSKLEVEVQASVAARNVAMNKLDEAERQLRITEENAGDALIALEETQNTHAHGESVEMQGNLAMATEYAEHERLASAKFLMLNRAYTEACQKSEKELKELSVIERECAHKIELLDSRLTKVDAEVVNVKLDGEEEDLAGSLIKITRKRETESKLYAHFLSVVQSNPENIEDVVEEEINRLQRILISLSDINHELIDERDPDIANEQEQEEKLFFYNQSIKERDLQWRNMKNDGPGRMKKFMMNGWALNNERCAGVMCNKNPLLQLKEERSCSICRGDGSGESGIYQKVKKYDVKRVLVSREIGERMLSGWKLLDEPCIKCTMPLMLKPLLLGNSKSEGKEEQGAPVSACSTSLSSIRVCIECGPNKEDILMAQRRKEVLTIAESEVKVAAAEKAKQEAEKKAERSTVEMEEQARKLIEEAEQQLEFEKRKAAAAEVAMYEAEDALHEAELLADSRAIDDRIRVMAEMREEKAQRSSFRRIPKNLSQSRREGQYRAVREDMVSSRDSRRENMVSSRDSRRENMVSSRDSRRFRGDDNVMNERIMLDDEEESHVNSVTVTIPDDFNPNDKDDIQSLMTRINGSRNRKQISEPIGMNIGVTEDNEQDSLSHASPSAIRSPKGMSPFHVRPVPGMTRNAVESDNSRMNSRRSQATSVRGGSHEILPQSHRDLDFTNDKRAISRSAHTLTKRRNDPHSSHLSLSSSKKGSISHSVRSTRDIRNERKESNNSNFDMIMSQIEATKNRLIDAKDQNNVGEQIEMASLLEKLATTAAAINNIE